MAERSFDNGFWADPFVQNLSKDAKLLYIYSFTNIHCNQAGLYQITLKTIAFETGLELDLIPELLDQLNEKIVWYPDHQLLWVKNFLRRQTRSPKFLIAASKCLCMIKDEKIVKQLLEYNHTLSIPYPYPIDTVAIPPTANAISNADLVSNADLETFEPEISTILNMIQTLPSWRSSKDDLNWLSEFMVEFPNFSSVDVKACRDRWDGKNPAKDKGDWKNRLRNWMRVENRRTETELSRQQNYKKRPEDDPREFVRRYGHLIKPK